MSTKLIVKGNIDQDIRLKTAVNSITPENVGKNMKDIVDLIPDLVSLPTPQIAKRKTYLPLEQMQEINSITPRTFKVADLITVDYPEAYYTQKLDIYFNTFGTDNNWLSLPEKRLELCMVSSKGYKPIIKKSGGVPSTGNKDFSNKKIVHPPNSGYAGNTIVNTIYSGGLSIGPVEYDDDNGITQKAIKQTEWEINFDENVNSSNNPSLTIEIDIRDFYKSKSSTFKYPYWLPSNGIRQLTVRGLGAMAFNTKTGRVYKKNTVLFFRLSAGVPSSWNEDKQRYDKRLFSDLSLPVYIVPKISGFEDGSTIEQYMYKHLVLIGVKT